jgi:hypothetical protein
LKETNIFEDFIGFNEFNNILEHLFSALIAREVDSVNIFVICKCFEEVVSSVVCDFIFGKFDDFYFVRIVLKVFA